jgi:hypothetical protein
MNILIININVDWVFNLYKEYIISFYNFVKKYYDNINVSIIFYDLNSLNISDLDNIAFENFHKIIYTGDIQIFNNIIVNKMDNLHKKLYYLNIEQLSHYDYYTMINSINPNVNFIDYSEENKEYLNKISNNAYLFPPYFTKKNTNICDKTIDIITLLNNDYRINIFKSIHLDNKYIFNGLREIFDEERDKIYASSKIYINIHGSEKHKTMELIRIINLLMNNVIVITDNSIFSDLLYIKDNIIICNNHNNLPTYVDEILNNYEKYYNKYCNFDENKYYAFIKTELNKFLLS